MSNSQDSASTISDGAATTAASTTDLSSSIVDTSSETSTVPEDITTTAIPTTSAESITAVEETTTATTEAAVVTGFLVNSGFDDTDTIQPWGYTPRAFTCVYKQNHIDRGRLALLLGFDCQASSSTLWVDTITFAKQ
ncbi:hypothetical protein FPSE_10981 [Fusarium pseudograminearum CS3096]|uniref:Uncharacterized protein n=1 Tax=Fusarium pseudograminearum (strain CS3096) TaxID=1028729 RepID=K3UBR9_FUSPC|nr:hypothetical protein FPSE_10981 [Fusarium pseudograminearum CS3096]EKJ68861.1 hypothetical protein FPSE_10981 [Fusarium pseudograminearum CS3096]